MNEYTATIEVEIEQSDISQVAEEVENAQIYGRGGRLLEHEVESVEKTGEVEDDE